ncbi:hypothetical protein [Streptomyces sp. ADMS]|uniref:hypothetical protein n=1 Tax=Streptomyces sp. ADMS TaxID=3071415 RepID=UPI003991B181
MTAINYFWRHPLAEQAREEGRVEERARMTLGILEWRGIPVPEAVRERVLACTHLEQLKTWAQRAVHATAADNLFVGDDDRT